MSVGRCFDYRQRQRIRLRLLAIALLVGLTGCGESAPPPAPALRTSGGTAKLTIVCTTGMVADIVQQVAGDQAVVTALFGAVDPHTYEPTAKDAERILSADVVFYSGLLLEGPTQKTLERAAARGRRVFAVTDDLKSEPDYIRYPAGGTGHPDPHVWMDVVAWCRCVESVTRILSEIDPTGGEGYRSRADRYRQQLKQLDAYARESIASIPEAQRHLVTAHDAFEYFSRSYSIPVHSVQGISTESEAGTDDINRLVEFLVTQQVPAVFVESTVNQANLRAVMEGAARRNWNVSVAAELYSDAMGPAGSYEGTYVGMIDHNVTRITRALGGNAPERGMSGKLAD